MIRQLLRAGAALAALAMTAGRPVEDSMHVRGLSFHPMSMPSGQAGAQRKGSGQLGRRVLELAEGAE